MNNVNNVYEQRSFNDEKQWITMNNVELNVNNVVLSVFHNTWFFVNNDITWFQREWFSRELNVNLTANNANNVNSNEQRELT
jgi:hypothetical protein